MKKLLLQTLSVIFAFSAQAQYAFTNFDINQGVGSSNPNYFIEHNGKLYFSADNGMGLGIEPFYTDGTPAGTQILADVAPGQVSSTPRLFTSYMGRLFFIALDTNYGVEVWGSNGTAAGTQLLRDIYPGKMSSSIHSIKVALGSLYFSANDSAHGHELWKSNGTTAGTVMVKDNNLGKPSGGGDPVVQFKGRLYHGGNDGTQQGMWESDGTSAGMKHFMKIGMRYPFEYNGKLYFTSFGNGGYEFWMSDGTVAGTQKMVNNRVLEVPFEQILYNGKFYFYGEDAISGNAFFVSDGTEAGTKQFAKNVPYPAVQQTSNTTRSAVYNGLLYYCAADTAHGVELWRTDGTAAGTVMVKDINPGKNFSSPSLFTVCAGKLYFKCTPDNNIGEQLFVTDGTDTGTHMISPTATPKYNALYSTTHLMAYKDTLYLQAWYDNSGIELWSVKDTSTTTSIAQINVENGLDVFPNPSAGKFTVKIKEDKFIAPAITVYNISGKEVYHMEQGNTAAIDIDMQGAAKGIYNLVIQDSIKVYTQKIMIE